VLYPQYEMAAVSTTTAVGIDASVRISPRVDTPSETSIRTTNAVDGTFAMQPLE